MARPIYNDKLMVHNFHVLDVDFSMAIPPWVLLPSAGFSSVTGPELTIGTEEITEGVDPFVHKVYNKASVNTITLQRGTSMFNSDFWRWITACLAGNKPYDGNMLQFLGKIATLQAPEVSAKRRNLIIMHLSGMSVEGLAKEIMSGSGGVLDKIGATLIGSVGGAAVIASDLIGTMTGGLLNLGISSVPGKVYMLFDALPTRYKPASDFDATSSEVSFEELDLEYHRFEEFSLLA